ncbi:MAG: LPS export ABC transporter protein LptC [bacterium]|jgi:LPS export ABC transporter protein LptC
MKYFIWVLTVTLVAFAGYLLIDVQNQDDKTPKRPQEIPLVLKKIDFYNYQKDFLKWVINAQYAEVFQKSGIVDLKIVNGKVLFKKQPSNWLRIQADKGYIARNSETLRLEGKVRLWGADGSILTTNEVFINQKKNLIYNRSKVHLQQFERHVTGKSFRYRIDKNQLQIFQPVIEANL